MTTNSVKPAVPLLGENPPFCPECGYDHWPTVDEDGWHEFAAIDADSDDVEQYNVCRVCGDDPGGTDHCSWAGAGSPYVVTVAA